MKAVPPPLPALSLSFTHSHLTLCWHCLWPAFAVDNIYVDFFLALLLPAPFCAACLCFGVRASHFFYANMPSLALQCLCTLRFFFSYFVRGAFCCHIYLSNHQQQQMRQTSLATSISRICRHSVQFLLHYYLFLQLKFFVLSLSFTLCLFFQQIEIVIYAGLDFLGDCSSKFLAYVVC